MVQVGFIKRIADRGYEDYVSMHKHVKAIHGGRKTIEVFGHRTQTSPTSATPVEFQETGGVTLSDAGKTNLTLKLASDTNDNAYDGHSVLGHYITNDGTKKDVTISYSTADTTTEVAFCADFFCWNLIDYTPATVLVSSIAVQAGDNIYIGTSGMVAGAEKRYATIAAAATYPLAASLFGVGNCFVKEESNTAGDVGKVIEIVYWTPWGQKRTAYATLAADTTTIVRFADVNGYYIGDFYRRYEIETSAVVGKYVVIGIDADKVVGTVALDTFYGVIEEGNYESVHTRQFVPGAAYGKKFIGDIHLCQMTSKDYPAILYVYFQTKGCATTEVLSWSINAGSDININLCYELEPLSEITYKIADDATHPVSLSMSTRNIEVDLAI